MNGFLLRKDDRMGYQSAQLEATDGSYCTWDQLERKIKTQRRQNVKTTWCVWWPHERNSVFWLPTVAEGGGIRENVTELQQWISCWHE